MAVERREMNHPQIKSITGRGPQNSKTDGVQIKTSIIHSRTPACRHKHVTVRMESKKYFLEKVFAVIQVSIFSILKDEEKKTVLGR